MRNLNELIIRAACFYLLIIQAILIGEKVLADVAPASCKSASEFKIVQPSSQQHDLQKLIDLTNWVEKSSTPIFSITISQNGKLFYQLYSSNIASDDAHYLMSVTKSVTSAAVGVALDKHLFESVDDPISKYIPKDQFENDAQEKMVSQLRLKDVLGMSALDVSFYPSVKTEEARKLTDEFFLSANRLKFSLKQKLVGSPGRDFHYTDATPILIGAALQYQAKSSLYDFANENLFKPMNFKNAEWMHQDEAGFDNAAYGLRLRPQDMQKFGILYLNSGCWEGRRLISEKWVATSFTPWINSRPTNHDPDYGWFWWKDRFNDQWIGHIANGWIGQRIAVFPERNVVVTMTGEIRDGSEEKVFSGLMNQFVIPYFSSPVSAKNGALQHDLDSALERVLKSKRIGPLTQNRLIPSSKAKEEHREFSGVRWKIEK